MHKFFNPYFALIIAVLTVSTSAILVKLAAAPAPITAAYRLLFTILIMLPFVFKKYNKDLQRVTKREWFLSSIAGLFLALHFVLWFESLNYTSVASSVVLVTLQPIFAFIGTYFLFKEKFTKLQLFSGLLAIGGSIMISWGDFALNPQALFGDLLALLGAIMITAYFLAGQKVRAGLSLVPYTFIVYGVSTLILFVYSALMGYSFFNYSSDTWIYFLLLALFPTLLGHTLFNWTLKWVSTSVISMAILFEPIGASILAYYLFNEVLVWTQWVGGSLVLIGLSLFFILKKR